MILSDYLNGIIDNRGKNPNRYFDKEKYPVIDNFLIKNELHPNIEQATRYIDEETYRDFLRGYVYTDMVIMTLVGNGIGNVTTILDSNSVIIQNTIGFNVNKKLLNDRFLYYYFCNNSELIRLFDRGSGQPSIKKTDLLNMEVLFPALEIQQKIATVLSSLDDKIEINNRINNNLEQQAQALFKSWFVDFEPFGGKMPEDWEKIKLSDIAEFISGYSYKGSELQTSSCAMATIKNFERNGGFKLDGFKEIIPSNKLKEKQLVDLFDTLVAHTDLTQNADVIGNAELLLSKKHYNKVILSMDLVRVLPKYGISKFLLAGILKNKIFKTHCLGYINGTTVLHLSKQALPEYEIPFPKKISTVKVLSESLEFIYKKLSFNIIENERLAQLRDTLLPKLMSGEIDVSNVNISTDKLSFSGCKYFVRYLLFFFRKISLFSFSAPSLWPVC